MDLSSAISYVRDHGIAMLTAPDSNVTAVAVSTKDQKVPITAATDFTVTAFVEKKLTGRELTRANVSPFDLVFTQAVGGHKPRKADIDVVESGTRFHTQAGLGLAVPIAQRGVYGGVPATVDTQKQFSTLRSGIGITNPVGEYPAMLSVGTLGFFVQQGTGGDVFLVSNNHVIGKSAGTPAEVAAAIGNAVVQPGTLDLTAGELAAWPTQAALVAALTVAEVAGVVRLLFRTPKTIPVNTVDAALAKLTTPNPRGLGDLNRVSFGGGIRGTAAYQTDPNDPNRLVGETRVYKAGRTTGYTEGEVIGIAGTASIPYPGGTAFFANQLVVRPTADNVGPFSSSGDSGSGVLNARHELVGLLFAGSGLQTLVNPIADVLAELGAVLGGAGLNVVTV